MFQLSAKKQQVNSKTFTRFFSSLIYESFVVVVFRLKHDGSQGRASDKHEQRNKPDGVVTWML